MDKTRCIEGDALEVSISLESQRAVDELEVGLVLPFGFQLMTGGLRWLVPVVPEEPTVIRVPVRATRWGVHKIGLVALRGFGPYRLVQYERAHDLRQAIRAYPAMEFIRTGPVPPRTQVFAGPYLSRNAGEGIEFADVRRFAPGDLVRRVNWGITSRRNELHVNLFTPERNADILLFIDSFSDVGPCGASSLDLSIRGPPMSRVTISLTAIG